MRGKLTDKKIKKRYERGVNGVPSNRRERREEMRRIVKEQTKYNNYISKQTWNKKVKMVALTIFILIWLIMLVVWLIK